MSHFRTIKKVVIAGDGAVGKTTTIAVLANYFQSRFESTYFKSNQPVELEDISRTRLIDFHTLQINHNDTKEIFQIWDIQGQRFTNPSHKVPTNPLDLIPKIIIGHASLIILMFSLQDYASFQHLFEEGGWYESIKEFIGKETNVLLVGNKSDLEQEVYDNIIEKTCSIYPISKFFSMSAIHGTNVQVLSEFIYNTLFSESCFIIHQATLTINTVLIIFPGEYNCSY